MKRLVQHPVGLCAVFSGLAALALALPEGPAPAQTKGGLPKIEPLTQKNYKETIPGAGVAFDMVAIPGGTYLMGSPANEAGHKADEGPQHPVAVRPFWIGKMEVTWDEYDLFWQKKAITVKSVTPQDKAADAVTRPTPPYADMTFGYGHEGNPALCMTHHAAMKYCEWLSAKTGKLYRLPTEAEWEWACRAGTTTPYFFGTDAGKLGEYAWFEKNSDEAPHKVGQKKANPWGLHDVCGNVAEWCIDHYKADYYKSLPADKVALQPVLLPTANRYSFTVRGGSWIDPADRCRSAARQGSNRDWLRRDPQRPQSVWWMTDADFIGFRVVRPVEEQANLKGLRSLTTKDSPD